MGKVELSYKCLIEMGSIGTNMVRTSAQQEFERLYNAYCGRIYSYAMMISKGDTYLSEEILQATFMKLWEHWSELKTPEKALQYLFATAKHTFLNYCEHEAVKLVYTDYVLARQDEADNHAEQQQDAQFLEAYLKEVISKMPPMRQRVFVMSRYQHKTNREIAEALRISEKTVEVHITLALRELKERLND